MSADRNALIAALDGAHDGHSPGQPELVLLGTARQELARAREIRARELVAGTAAAGIAAVIAAECGPDYGTTRIRAYRLALGIALADVVAQVRAWYAADGRKTPRFSETLLSAYEGGQKRPGPEYLHYLCAAYRADPDDLGYAGPCLCGRSHRAAAAQRWDLAMAAPSASAPPAIVAPAIVAPASAPPAIVAPAIVASAIAPPAAEDAEDAEDAVAGDEDDDELRCVLLRLMTAAGTGVDSRFLGAVDRIRRRMDDALLGGTVSATMLDRWEQTMAGYGRRYMTVPPLRLLCDALLDFGDVRRMCEERQPLEFSERLCRLAGQLAGLAGIAMIDLGDQRLARSFFRTARTAADETGDRRLRAWVAVREALVPLYYGDPREAASLAGAAIDLAGRHACVARVMAPVVEARALARLARQSGRGRREALDRARAALDRAQDSLADLPAEQTRDTAFGYTERQLLFHAGDTLVMVGDCQGAERAFAQALRQYPAAEFLDSTLVVLGQARCLLQCDEPEQALRLGRDTLLGLPAEHRTEIILEVGRALGHEAAARYSGLPAIRDFRDAFRSA